MSDSTTVTSEAAATIQLAPVVVAEPVPEQNGGKGDEAEEDENEEEDEGAEVTGGSFSLTVSLCWTAR